MKWQVECYGEGSHWEHTGLTYERACEIVTNMPKEYMAYIEPMDEVDE